MVHFPICIATLIQHKLPTRFGAAIILYEKENNPEFVYQSRKSKQGILKLRARALPG